MGVGGGGGLESEILNENRKKDLCFFYPAKIEGNWEWIRVARCEIEEHSRGLFLNMAERFQFSGTGVLGYI